MKILLADDDVISRRVMERMLQSSGYDVVTAENGRQALDKLTRDGGPRLALLDWMMPELDGLDVCRMVRERDDTSYVYTLLLTSRESPEDVVAGLKAGADDYLTKPCNMPELKARLHAGQRILMLEDKLVESREAMRFDATHDALTKLLNRGAIVERSQIELKRSRAQQIPACLILCDIDHFKRINDVHGHLVGDEVLRQVADRLKNSVRAGDIVGRYGGEEFLILLQGRSEERLTRNAGGNFAAGVTARAEQIRQAICSTQFATQAGPLSVSISAGALVIEDRAASLPIEILIAPADEALYRAKAAGRNRVVFAGSAGIPIFGTTRLAVVQAKA